ncbi:LacI family transcriptional regulator [Paenibacillus sp. TRM 82003]|uniref:LacI family DNA-binding transcriptional regulator n=1 Tax=Kineococcus sp. TRM81007 TaxID=2925831 RepID=UPI001F5AB058|nr:LacI family DNA-binding transcriptional regulator [Kineococcus sp. TRM81007]MCI2239821.1 LacI family transcriptional regulator [Kineococcus sp. TRM81007]MCI3925876.1 LacI family transcriptional regulator [Paenibacillus sp. TRM 82003]
MPSSTRPSQRDIARVAQVSQAAVSLVLNGKAGEKGIAPATQEKIRAAMASLGYVPNAAARSLRGGRNGLIGVHTFESVFPVAADDYYHEFLVGIEEQAVAQGQDLVLFASTQLPDGTRSVYGRGSNRLRLTDGAVVLGRERNEDEMERLALEGFPFVLIGNRAGAVTPVPYVAADYTAAVAEVLRALAAAGHRRTAYLGMAARRRPQEERLRAFLALVPGAALASSTPHLVEAGTVTGEWVDQQLALGTTAFVVETPEHAGELADLLSARGLRVPADVSVACLDVPAPGSAALGWSHVAVARRAMGARAVRVLLGLLEGDVPPTHVDVVPCLPLRGSSIGAPPGR